jgi:hypothetical protein
MRPSRIVGAAAWLVLIGCFSALLFFGWQTFRVRLETSNSFPEYSSYRADPKGLKAFYESLQGTDVLHVGRRLQSSKVLSSGKDQVLIVAGVQADQQAVSDQDSELFDHWLATGGRLIIALRSERSRSTASRPAPRATRDEPENASLISWRSLIGRWGAELTPHGHAHPTPASSTLFGTLSRWLGDTSFDRLTSDWKAIAVQGEKKVIVERAFDHGSLVLLADSYPLSNEALAADRNTGFLLWLIDNRLNVVFEETHLGLGERPGIMTLARRYGLQGALISIVAVLLLFIWKCQYTLIPRTKINQNESIVSGRSSDQVFLNLLQRMVSRKDLLGVCITTWRQTVRPTPAQLDTLEKFRSGFDAEKPIVERYNQLTTLLNKKL